MSQREHTSSNLSSHRLPTISASQALHELEVADSEAISTGLPTLDSLLAGRPAESGGITGGFLRRHVYEIYGPPGSGKTALAIQAANSTLKREQEVIWIDTGHRLPGKRLAAALVEDSTDKEDPLLPSESSQDLEQLLNRFHHFTVPTLPHLLALLAHPSTSFPSRGTGLIVIDTVSNVFSTAFPRATDSQNAIPRQAKKPEAAQWAVERRWAVMGDFTAKMNKLATVRNITILLLSQTSTNFKTEHGVLLRPSLSSKNWLENINTRLIVFRDFIPSSADKKDGPKGGSFVGLVKHKGIFYEALEHVVPFIISKRGLTQISLPKSLIEKQRLVLPTIPEKRKRLEVADSESEDEDNLGSDTEFGWMEDDALALISEDDDNEVAGK